VSHFVLLQLARDSIQEILEASRTIYKKELLEQYLHCEIELILATEDGEMSERDKAIIK
jgi:hypothetical protein